MIFQITTQIPKKLKMSLVISISLGIDKLKIDISKRYKPYQDLSPRIHPKVVKETKNRPNRSRIDSYRLQAIKITSNRQQLKLVSLINQLTPHLRSILITITLLLRPKIMRLNTLFLLLKEKKTKIQDHTQLAATMMASMVIYPITPLLISILQRMIQ